MAKALRFLAPLLCAIPLAACAAGTESTGASSDELRGLSKDEALAEMTQIGDAIRAYYGPLQFKAQRFGFDLDAAIAAAKTEIQNGQNEADFVRPVYELISKLHDGHVSYDYPLKGDQTAEYTIPMIVTPVEGQLLVDAASPSVGVTRGDVLVSIDGLTVDQMEQLINPVSTVATPESTKHYAAANMTIRPFYAPKELLPRGPKAHIVMKKADGTQYTLDVPWRVSQGGLAGQVQPPQQSQTPGNPAAPHTATFSNRANWLIQRKNEMASSVLDQGASQPFWLTAPVRQQFGMVEVKPKTDTLTAFGVTVPAGDDTAADTDRYIWMRAYKYKFGGKTIMVVRIPSFITPKENYDENVAWLASLLKDNMAPATPGAQLADMPADMVVVDDTANPGGSVPYVSGLASLFATSPIPNDVMAHHADRKWISQMLAAANQSDAAEQPIWLDRMKKIETAFDSGQLLSPYFPIIGSFVGPNIPLTPDLDAGANMLAPHPKVQWNKPVLVLHDELSGSGGDVFPDLLQNGGVAKTFGARTMGLGGSVEPVITLPFSQAQLHLTRGLMGPYNPSGDPKLIENEGVTPNFPYSHTVADFRAGYVGYVKAFSQIASTLTR
jgi:hypothetical protein